VAFLELPLTPFSTSVAMTVSIDGAMVGNDADVMHGSFIRFSGVGWSALVRQCFLRRTERRLPAQPLIRHAGREPDHARAALAIQP